TKQTALDAYAHQQLPFELLVDKLQPTRSLSHAPLFQIMLALHNNDEITLNIPDTELATVQIQDDIAKFDLTLNVMETLSGLYLKWEYNSDIFSKDTIKRLSNHFCTYLTSLLIAPQKPIFDVSILSEIEIRKLKETWAPPSKNLPTMKGVHTQFEKQVAEHPKAIALVHGSQSLSYIELNRYANRFAHYLLEQGVEANSLVGICLPRSIDMIISILAILKVGAAYVPLDPVYPLDRLNYMIHDANLKLLLTNETMASILSLENCQAAIIEDITTSIGYSQLSDQNQKLASFKPTDLCYVIYTSGSTGRPKGVMIEHRNVFNFFAGLNEYFVTKNRISNSSVWLATTSISFDISVLEIIWNLCSARKVILQHDKSSQQLGKAVPKKINLSLFYFAADEKKEGDKFKLLIEGAKYADQNQFSAVWMPERHFHRFGGQFPNPSIAAAALSTCTSHIELRSGSVVLPLHDPIQIAEEWSMVDNLSRGRVGLSFASGWHPNDFVLSPDNYDIRNDVLKNSIEEFKKLWRGLSLRRKNGLGQNVKISLFPRPIQSMPKIWITAAGNPDTFDYAGKIGANILTHLLGQSLDELENKIAIYKNSLKQNGFDPDTCVVSLMLHTFLGDDAIQIEQTVKQPFIEYLKNSINLVKPIATESGLDLEADQANILEIAFNRFYSTGALFGTVDTAIHRLDELQQLGVNEIACLIDFGIEEDVVLKHLSYLKTAKDKYEKLRKHLEFTREIASNTANDISWEHAKESIDSIQSTPSMLHALLENKEIDLSSVRTILIGGEAWDVNLANKIRAATNASIYNMYGPTETTVWSAIREVSGDRVLIGKPIVNTQFYVVNSSLHLQPIGVPGELLIGGDGVARGYLNNPDLTKEKFIDSPFHKGSKLYRTGDLVRYLSNGSIEYLSRLDGQIKIRGHRIEIGEIEHVLNSHNDVRESAVVVKESDGFNKQLVAYFVPINTLSTVKLQSTLMKWLEQKLPNYMIPSAIVSLESFPVTPNGKVDKIALVNYETDYCYSEYVEPDSEFDKSVCMIVEEILNAKRVGMKDNFFSIGGNSLSAIKFVNKINSTYEINLPVNELFKARDMSAISDLVRSQFITFKSANLKTQNINVTAKEW
ncbi:MAG: LLM class flavin-dependent oxidoreductase, partial [Gammaproteobacteria bacterium]|nr:LLM class flavin-dependent oxidoreductase [Gammaproteobacteria bacterium]